MSVAPPPPSFPATSLPFPADWNAAQLCTELAASLAHSAAIDRELSELVESRGSLERLLAKSTPHLTESVDSLLRAHGAAGAVVSASHVSAQALSSQVRALDEVAANVSAALGRVESVLSLRHTIARVREKLATHALLPAADELWRALFVATPIENDLSFTHLLELEKRLREEVHRESLERWVRQGQEGSALETKEVMKLARIWPKVGFGYRGLVTYCAQVRLECLSLIHRSGWSLQNQHEHALLDYTRNVGSIIEAVNGCIIQHLLVVQSLFGNGAQIRLIQELLAHVIDGEVAAKLLARFIDEKKLKDPKGGTLNPNIDDVISRIKQVNLRVQQASAGHSGAAAAATYFHPRDPNTQLGSILYIQTLDELLDEIKLLSHDIEHFLKGVDQLARQSLDFLLEAVANEKEQRDQHAAKQQTSESELKRKDDLFQRFLSTPNLASLPSVHVQHERVMTMLHRLLQEDKHQRNLLDVPVVEERAAFGARPALPSEGPIPAALLQLSANSPFLITGFGLEANLVTASRLYDMQLTIIGKYVLIEEYYMNYNVEKAIAIDEHNGTSGHALNEDDAARLAANPAHDDLESELEAADVRKERERLAASGGGLQSLASAISSSSLGADPHLYLTGLGGAPTGVGIPKTFLAKFSTHKTSTLVDNVCFLYKKCLQRALKTSNRDAIYSVLLRVHENCHKKLGREFDDSIQRYEMRYGSKRKTSLAYALFQNPSAYLTTATTTGGGARSNLLGALVSAAGAGGSPTSADLARKVNADVSLVLTVNNLDSTIENMQALLKYIDHSLEELYGEDAAPQQTNARPAINYTRGLSLDQIKEKLVEFHSTFLQFDELIGRGLQCIADSCWLRLLPRISLLQTHAGDLYAQSELSSSSADLSEQVVSGYIEVFKRDILSLASVLSENNLYQLVFKALKLTVRFIENLVLPKQTANGQPAYDASGQPIRPLQFTQSGGVQFDKQIRTLTSFFTNDVAAHLERYFADNSFLFLQPISGASSSSSSSLAIDASLASKQWRVSFSGSAQARQLFSKLAHVGSILSVDKPAEVLEYTERELFNLKKDEVRRILSLRKEFSEREISQLKL